MRILIADKFQPQYLEDLKTSGHDVIFNPDLTADKLPENIKGNEVLIVRSTKVNSQTIKASDCLTYIIRAGAGTNTIDKEAAAAKGIFVCNTPAKNSIAVAELAIGLMVSIDRHIPACNADMKNKVWNKKKYSKANGIFGKNVGVVGLGAIGMAFVERAKAFGLTIFGYDPIAQKIKEHEGVNYCETLQQLAENSDIITFHVPAITETKGMVGKEFLSYVKKGAYIINTSRGAIVDDQALIDAMNEKDIKAALDVYNNEPAAGDNHFATELSQHPNVIGTHHIGASTDQSQNAIGATVVELISGFEKGNIKNCVNMESSTVSTSAIVMRMFDKVGALSNVLAVLKNESINVENLETLRFAGRKAASVTMQLSKVLSPDILEKLRKLDGIIQVSVKIDESLH